MCARLKAGIYIECDGPHMYLRVFVRVVLSMCVCMCFSYSSPWAAQHTDVFSCGAIVVALFV